MVMDSHHTRKENGGQVFRYPGSCVNRVREAVSLTISGRVPVWIAQAMFMKSLSILLAPVSWAADTS
jgi:hypothetical protein